MGDFPAVYRGLASLHRAGVRWPEAFARCEELLHGVRDRHGIEAMTAFIGNPAGHSFSIGRYGALLMGQANFPMIYSAGTVDHDLPGWHGRGDQRRLPGTATAAGTGAGTRLSQG